MSQLAPTTIIVQAAEARHEVKRSIFIAIAEPLADPAATTTLLDRHRDDNARHHCWAWRCDGDYRFNDDGEPAGTAGRPILQAIEGAEIDRTLVIVRRYFGGIKLGAGGLVRAYSAATAGCLDVAQTRQLIPHVQLEVHVPFEYTQALFQLLAACEASPPQHTSAGVKVEALVPVDHCECLLDELRNHTRGQVEVRRCGTRLA